MPNQKSKPHAPISPRLESVAGGYVLMADSTHPDTWLTVRALVGYVPLIIADGPYGNIVDEAWDRINVDDHVFSEWMLAWTRGWTQHCLLRGGAFYVWGGAGKPGFRPFLKYLTQAEQPGCFELANLITWKKKRAYGVPQNYLWTREELAYFVNGPASEPRTFHIPLLEQERGYAGYSKKYPAKSKYLRRTNVWTDITEIFKGKLHTAQKKQRVMEIPIEVHTHPGEWVVDPFAGAGTTADAARKLGRQFVIIENDEATFESTLSRLRAG